MVIVSAMEVMQVMHLMVVLIVLVALFSFSTISIEAKYITMPMTSTVKTGVVITANKIGLAAQPVAEINFLSTLTSPVSVYSQSPVSLKPGQRLTFTVSLPVKNGRTAIGFSFNKPISTYLTPDYTTVNNYISMGGAGFIYPMKVSAKRGYQQGDKVSVLYDETSRSVTFQVNDRSVYKTTLPSDILVKCLYPTVSCQAGADVTATVAADISQS